MEANETFALRCKIIVPIVITQSINQKLTQRIFLLSYTPILLLSYTPILLLSYTPTFLKSIQIYYLFGLLVILSIRVSDFPN